MHQSCRPHKTAPALSGPANGSRTARSSQVASSTSGLVGAGSGHVGRRGNGLGDVGGGGGGLGLQQAPARRRGVRGVGVEVREGRGPDVQGAASACNRRLQGG